MCCGNKGLAKKTSRMLKYCPVETAADRQLRHRSGFLSKCRRFSLVNELLNDCYPTVIVLSNNSMKWMWYIHLFPKWEPMSAKNKTSAFIESISMPFEGLGYRALLFVSILFCGAGLLSTYLGVTDHYTITLVGGPISLLIGIVLIIKSVHKHSVARQRKIEKRHRQFLNSVVK